VTYLRFTVLTNHPDTGVADGVFRTAYALRDTGGISRTDRDTLAEQLEWFSKNLLIPKRFNRSASKGHYRRATKGIAWFREDAGEHISRMFELKRVLEANGHPVHVVRENRVGYIVYEDDAQVIAEPFADTRAGP
jgi:hypothetical protein